MSAADRPIHNSLANGQKLPAVGTEGDKPFLGKVGDAIRKAETNAQAPLDKAIGADQNG